MTGQILEHPAFADIDRHFSAFIARCGGGEAVELTVAALSRAVRLGNICLDLAVAPVWDGEAPCEWPSSRDLISALEECRAVGEPGALSPLVLSGTRLYLRRYWNYEQSLAKSLKLRSAGERISQNSDDAQVIAVQTALARKLTVISGGPGTGKTKTAVDILAEIDPKSRIVLAAPTGKAATRLEEAVRKGFAERDKPAPAARASTLHRLLGVRPGSATVRYNANNPVVLDWLIVDEASMVPLPLMAKLFAALPSHARVVLLGDRDQLASVEPGSVLADIADAASVSSCPLHDCFVTLTKNYRFGNESAIYRLCQAVRVGDTNAASAILGEDGLADLGSAPTPAEGDLRDALKELIIARYGEFVRQRDPAQALEAFGHFRVLCAPRRGPFGVEEVNRVIAGILTEAGLIDHRGGEIYRGMPVLVTRNDYQVGLFNGDIGIVLPDPAEHSGRLFAWFYGEDGRVKRVPSASLPEHEPAYAMTVHKSQGSEFTRVLMLLPDRDTLLLTRELIYTGITRARKRVDVWVNPDVLEAGVGRRTDRASGLKEALTV